MSNDELEPLVTDCPNCHTRFRVTETQLQVAAGRVRCGACLTVFQGVDRLLWERDPGLPEGQAQELLDELLDELSDSTDEQHPVIDPTVEIDPEDEIDDDEDEDVEELVQVLDTVSVEELAVEEEGSDEVVIDSVAVEDIWQPADEDIWKSADREDVEDEGLVPVDEFVSGHSTSDGFAEAQVPRERVSFAPEKKHRWWVPPAMVLAMALLVAQVMFLQFGKWSKDLRIRPVYAWACAYIGCELPVLHDLDRMVVRKLVVRSHPEIDGGLIVDAIIVNEALFAQPFPVLELRFTSIEGNLVAGGRFQPE